jgi:hypothetical protein
VDLASRISPEETPGIEAGPELLYRCFLQSLGIDEADLRLATARLALRMQKHPA